MHYYIDVVACGNGGAHLAEVFLGFAKELLGFAVVCSVFVFYGKGLGVQDKLEVAEEFLALTGELDGHH